MSEFACDRCGVNVADGEGRYVGNDRVCDSCSDYVLVPQWLWQTLGEFLADNCEVSCSVPMSSRSGSVRVYGMVNGFGVMDDGTASVFVRLVLGDEGSEHSFLALETSDWGWES